MRRLYLMPLLLLSAALSACNSRTGEVNTPKQEETFSPVSFGIQIIVGTQVITATLEDNTASRDLLSRLPLEVTLEDFNHITEKIFYPSPALDTGGVERGCTPQAGDITIYAPWQNVAIFCKPWKYSRDLIKIGHIDGEGIKVLQVAGDIPVRLERMQ